MGPVAVQKARAVAPTTDERGKEEAKEAKAEGTGKWIWNRTCPEFRVLVCFGRGLSMGMKSSQMKIVVWCVVQLDMCQRGQPLSRAEGEVHGLRVIGSTKRLD